MTRFIEHSMQADPILTASIYCSGRLDSVISQVMVPFWKKIQGESYWLWVLRYSRGGEHLKIRLHGPKVDQGQLRNLLEEQAQGYLASLGPSEDAPRVSRHDVPPIDFEDEAPSPPPDRSFLWTTYRRSGICFGGEPLLFDDCYAELLVRCFAHGFQLALSAFQADGNTRLANGLRHSTLLKALVAGLSTSEFTQRERIAYLSYHRNWLLRALIARDIDGPEKSRELLAKLDLRVDRSDETLNVLRRAVHSQWGNQSELSPNVKDSSWRHALSSLMQYGQLVGQDPDYHIDPFATSPCSPLLFKALHGLANQLGLDQLNEAYVYHLLLHAARGKESDTGVPLIPDFAE